MCREVEFVMIATLNDQVFLIKKDPANSKQDQHLLILPPLPTTSSTYKILLHNTLQLSCITKGLSYDTHTEMV